MKRDVERGLNENVGKSNLLHIIRMMMRSGNDIGGGTHRMTQSAQRREVRGETET